MSFLSRLFGKADPAPPLDPLGYAEAYAAAVRRAHPSAEVTVHPAPTAAQTRVAWRTPAGWDSQQFFGNYHARYLQSPGELRRLIALQLAEAEAIVADPEPAEWRASLLPVLKTQAWQDIAVAQLKAVGAPDEGATIVARPLVADLLVTYVSDLPKAMAFVTAGELAKRGVGETELHEAALANLAERLPALRVEGGKGRYAARLDSNYDASMVLLLDRWRDRIDIEGDLLLAVPARDEMLVCPAGDAATAASLADMAASIVARSAYSLTSRLLLWRSGRLEALPGPAQQ